jgi:hypothetical protein
LPLPSSPHCTPTIPTLGINVILLFYNIFSQ